MESSRLQDDLLLEFRAERDMINTQLELLDPLAIALRKPVAVRLLHKGILIALEGLCWAGAAASVAFCIFRDQIYPFYLLKRLRIKGADTGFSERDTLYLYWSVTVFALTIAVLLLIIARNLSRLRRKNSIIQLAAKHIKTVTGQHLSRKAAIDTIEQRHFGILSPLKTETIVLPE
jgi:hypothetical protein